jgi:hypothetical protein
MKPIIKFVAFILLIGIVIFISCKKEHSCESCRQKNQPPIARAGNDTTLTLPIDSVQLNGSGSTDPDGTITSYKWTKIAGPASSIIIKADSSKTLVKTVKMGVYKFELTVADNDGLFAKDTVQITVNDPALPNRPPAANAGADQIISLPTNTVDLDGSGSTDPDNNISSYAWTKISGPSSFNIANANAVQTQVNNLVQGVYQFELKVTDAGGLFSKDTVQVTVSATSVIIACDGSIRSQVNVQLIPIGTLPFVRYGTAVTSVGNKIFFAGGFTVYGYIPSSNISRVDIFDVTTNSWSTAELSQSRSGISTAILGNKVFFSGGSANTQTGKSSRVDIYDALTNTWTTTNLSSDAISMTGAAAGNKVLFAGGFREYGPSRRVDIYDASTNTWSIDSLTNRTPEAVVGISATVIGNKIFFAGASEWAWDFGQNSSTINIYDADSSTWSISSLSVARGYMAAIAVGNKNYWAGGNGYPGSAAPSDQVEIRDMNTGTSSFACLFQPNAYFSAVQKDNKIIFFTGAWGGLIVNKFDIYDIATNTWSIGVLNQNIEGASIVSVNNAIYVAGGYANGVLSNQVWKLEF